MEEDITKVTVCYSMQEDESDRERSKMSVLWGSGMGRRKYGMKHNNNNNKLCLTGVRNKGPHCLVTHTDQSMCNGLLNLGVENFEL